MQIDRWILTSAATTMPRWTIRTSERRRPAASTLSASLGCSQVGVGRFRGRLRGRPWTDPGCDEAHRAPANRRATVIMVCREAWSALVSSSRGVSFRWTGRSARLDSHVWDAG